MSSSILIYLITPLLAAFSQVLLKKAADNPRYTGIYVYLNVPVAVAYVVFFGCMLANVFALKMLDVSVAGILEASGYFYTVFLAHFFLSEKITMRKLLGNIFIIGGIALTLLLP